MNLQYVIITGVFFNMLMAAIFPGQLLSPALQESLLGDDSLNYDFDGQNLFGEQYEDNIDTFYTDTRNEENLQDIYNAEDSVTTNPLETVSGFFDGLLDALTKAKAFLSFIVPFASLFYLLPGALGLIVGSLYASVFAIAVIRFIRGV